MTVQLLGSIQGLSSTTLAVFREENVALSDVTEILDQCIIKLVQYYTQNKEYRVVASANA